MFSISKGDYLEIDIEGVHRLMLVSGTGDGDIEMYRPNDARPKGKKNPERSLGRFSATKLFAANPRKVTVSPIGEIRPNNE